MLFCPSLPLCPLVPEAKSRSWLLVSRLSRFSSSCVVCEPDSSAGTLNLALIQVQLCGKDTREVTVCLSVRHTRACDVTMTHGWWCEPRLSGCQDVCPHSPLLLWGYSEDCTVKRHSDILYHIQSTQGCGASESICLNQLLGLTPQPSFCLSLNF